MPRFHVRDAFAINDKSAYILAGFGIEGEIAAGMLVRIPVHASTMMTAPIDHIQTLERPDGNVVCLCIACAEPKAAALWDALKLKDHTIEIIAATDR